MTDIATRVSKGYSNFGVFHGQRIGDIAPQLLDKIVTVHVYPDHIALRSWFRTFRTIQFSEVTAARVFSTKYLGIETEFLCLQLPAELICFSYKPKPFLWCDWNGQLPFDVGRDSASFNYRPTIDKISEKIKDQLEN